MKKTYESPELEIIELDGEDIIRTSGPSTDIGQEDTQKSNDDEGNWIW